MKEINDWRLTNQAKFLTGVKLVMRRYGSSDPDHDHCVFCWNKFSKDGAGGALIEGYCTKDGKHWICESCFKDFSEMFDWHIEESS